WTMGDGRWAICDLRWAMDDLRRTICGRGGACPAHPMVSTRWTDGRGGDSPYAVAFGLSIPTISGRSRPTTPDAVAVPAVALPNISASVPPRSCPPPRPPTAPRIELSIGPSDFDLFTAPATLPPTAPLNNCTSRDVTSIDGLL